MLLAGLLLLSRGMRTIIHWRCCVCLVVTRLRWVKHLAILIACVRNRVVVVDAACIRLVSPIVAAVIL